MPSHADATAGPSNSVPDTTDMWPCSGLPAVPCPLWWTGLDATPHLAVLHDTEAVYVIEERAPGGPTLVTDVDVRLPAHLTASGCAILADLADNHLRALFSRQGAFIRRTENGPSSWAALCRILAESRSRGYATENEEVTEGFASIAVAVSDHTRHPVAAVAVTFPVALESADLRAELVARVSRTAADLSRRVGGAALELPVRRRSTAGTRGGAGRIPTQRAGMPSILRKHIVDSSWLTPTDDGFLQTFCGLAADWVAQPTVERRSDPHSLSVTKERAAARPPTAAAALSEPTC
jgi:hypothetical protein